MFDLFTPPPETRPKPFTCDFHEDNPHVYQQFVRLAFQAIDKNKKRISHVQIMNVIRWELYLETEDEDGFKINNNAIAFYPRKFLLQYPQYVELFDLRKSQFDREFADHIRALDSQHLKPLLERIEN